LGVVLDVVRRRVLDRWAERRSGRRRRWIEAFPPAGQSGRFVLVRGMTAPIRREVAGPEFAPDDAPQPVARWRRSEFWRRDRDLDPYVWRPTPEPPPSRRRDGR